MPTTPVSGKKYIIMNFKSQTVLDRSGTDGASITGWKLNMGENQIWTLNQQSDMSWKLRNNFDPPSSLGMWNYAGQGTRLSAVIEPESFKWFIERDNSKDVPNFRIYTPDWALCVDLSGYGKPDNGTPIELWPRNFNNTNQLWTFEEVLCNTDNACYLPTPLPLSATTPPSNTTTVSNPLPLSATTPPSNTTTISNPLPLSATTPPSNTTTISNPLPLSATTPPSNTTTISNPLPLSATTPPSNTTTISNPLPLTTTPSTITPTSTTPTSTTPTSTTPTSTTSTSTTPTSTTLTTSS